MGRSDVSEVFADESNRMDPSVETLILLTFWPCQCTEPDIARASVEPRRDGERIVDVRACRECWGDVATSVGSAKSAAEPSRSGDE
jgi:hypothetical protein